MFSNLTSTSHGYKVRKTHKVMSSTTLRDQFRAAFLPHVSDISKYCMHSLMTGGASATANNGVKDRMFKRHGR